VSIVNDKLNYSYDIPVSVNVKIVMSSINAVRSLNSVIIESMLVKSLSVNILLKKYATENAK